MSGFYHEREWNESTKLMETSEQQEVALDGAVRSALPGAA